MNSYNNNYRNIIKSTSIFGGVQFLNIVFKLIGSKFLAVFLGPSGLGILGLFNSTISLISNLTNIGIGTSAVRNLSTFNGKPNSKGLFETNSVIKKLVLLTGIVGCVFTYFLSGHISNLTFGSNDYKESIKLISIVILFNQLIIGEKVLLQGLRKVKDLAKTTILSGFIGLIGTIPLYYFFGIQGIVPSLIFTSLTSYFFFRFFSRKIKFPRVKWNLKEFYETGGNILKTGVVISLSSILTSISAYILRIYINRHGGDVQLGLFSSGFAIMNTYVGLVFTAMATDYYPKLSSIADDNNSLRSTINQQATISILILAPLLVTFIIFIKQTILLLYSDKFIAVSPMLYWATLGIFFKTISWSIGYSFLAKGNTKIYFWNEFIAIGYTLILNLLLYNYFGLEGLGISFLISYIIHSIQVYIVVSYKYDYYISKNLKIIFILQTSIGVACFLLQYFISSNFKYIIGGVMLLVSIYFSLSELDKRVNLRELFRRNKIK